MMEINQIISLANHCLHLCHDSDIEEIVFSYLMDADVFVTNNIEAWKKTFDENKVNSPIKKPDAVKQNMRIVVDGASLGNDFEKWEKRWGKQEKVICVYNIEKIDSAILKDLVNIHDKMVLSINKVRVLSDKNLEEEIDGLNPEIVENLVKRELKNIVLSLILSEPMCGTDLIKTLYRKFKVFISPGMLYPALHELEKNGLLKCEYSEYKLKSKIYSVQKKEQAQLMLENHSEVNSLLSKFLVGE